MELLWITKSELIMDKPNVFRSSSFYMDEGDTLTVEILAEAGKFPYIELVNAATPSIPDDGLVVDYDGNVYRFVTIGNRQWLTENFKCEHYQDGSAIPIITNDASWAADSTGAMCYFDNNEAESKPAKGALYNHFAVANSSLLGIEGWRISTSEDWADLLTAVGGDTADAGGKLKDTVYWDEPNTGATNEYGFTAKGAGVRGAGGAFEGDIEQGVFWLKERDDGDTIIRSVLYDSAALFFGDIDDEAGCSVRLVRTIT